MSIPCTVGLVVGICIQFMFNFCVYYDSQVHDPVLWLKAVDFIIPN